MDEPACRLNGGDGTFRMEGCEEEEYGNRTERTFEGAAALPGRHWPPQLTPKTGVQAAAAAAARCSVC